MSKFFTVREPLVVKVGGQEHTFFIRELPYLQFLEITRQATAEPNMSVSALGTSVVESVILAAVEEQDGSKSYASAEEWRNELKSVMEALSRAAMKAQGLDLDAKRDEPLSAEQAEGNA